MTAVTLARLFGVGGLDLEVTIIAASVPTASGADALAKLMGGDAALMAEIITIQTLASLATIPLDDRSPEPVRAHAPGTEATTTGNQAC